MLTIHSSFTGLKHLMRIRRFKILCGSWRPSSLMMGTCSYWWFTEQSKSIRFGALTLVRAWYLIKINESQNLQVVWSSTISSPTWSMAYLLTSSSEVTKANEIPKTSEICQSNQWNQNYSAQTKTWWCTSSTKVKYTYGWKECRTRLTILWKHNQQNLYLYGKMNSWLGQINSLRISKMNSVWQK